MSDNRELFDPSKISIIEFKMIKGQVDTPEEFDANQVQGHHLENSLQLGFNLEDKLVKTDFFTEIKTESHGQNTKEAVGSFHLVFIFSVENLHELATFAKGELIKVHPTLGNAVSSISYSTSRGILLTRLQGTALQNFILPVINPNSLLNK